MNKRDRDALRLALKLARKDQARAKQLDDKLKDEPWEDVAVFASYSMQCKTLRLRPWESPPLFADAEFENSPGARALLQRMLHAGVSRFHPDPMRALAEAETEPQPAA